MTLRRTHLAPSSALLLLPLAAVSVAGEPAAEPVRWLECTLQGLPGDPRLLIMTVGDRVERAVLPKIGMAVADVSRLRVTGAGIGGEIVVGHAYTRQNHTVPPLAVRLPLTLDLSIAGAAVSGTCAGRWANDRGSAVDVRGSVSGVARDEARLRAEQALPSDATWPSYVGPNQNFSSGASGRPIIADLSRARLLWASQYIGPCESGSKRYGACVGAMPSAGGASPLVGDGRVYQFRSIPGGDVYHKHLDDQLAGPRGAENRAKMAAIGWTDAEMRRRWAVSADEELVCIDAATGRTLWTTTWPGEGINLYDHKCSLTNHTGVLAGGHVYTLGALGALRCVDGRTGALRWRADVPGLADGMRALKEKALAARDFQAPGRAFNHGLNVSGGTIVAPDGTGSCGMVGFDAASGKQLWRVPGPLLGGGATPIVWSGGGRDLVIAAAEDGSITGIDAASGAKAWRYAEAGHNQLSVIRVGDLLIGHKLTAERIKALPKNEDPGGVFSAPGDNYGQVACWRIGASGLTQVWEAPTAWGAPYATPIGAATDGLVCFRGNYSYHIVKPETGERVASAHLSSPARWDEGHMLALPGVFLLHPDSQHGETKFYPLPAKAGATCGAKWSPPHPHATTYAVAMSHAWADGRLFIRGVDAIYCYDLREPPRG